MKRVTVFYDMPNWVFHNLALELERWTPGDFRVTHATNPFKTGEDVLPALAKEDLVFYMGISTLPEMRALISGLEHPPVLVGYWALGWPHKRDDYDRIHGQADFWICNNHGYWSALGRPENMVQINNGVNHELFQVSVPITARPHRVLWTGSEHHRDIKEYDDIILPLAAELDRRGIDRDFMLVDSFSGGLIPHREMPDWYNSGTILVCASKTEGTPNPALEAAACGCTVISTKVGNMPELIANGENGYLTDHDLGAILDAILMAEENYLRLATRMQEDIRQWRWKDRCDEIFSFFRRLLDSTSP